MENQDLREPAPALHAISEPRRHEGTKEELPHPLAQRARGRVGHDSVSGLLVTAGGRYLLRAMSSRTMSGPLPRRKPKWRMWFAMTAVALLLVVVGSAVDWRGLSVDGLDGALNDQVGYISVARDFADHGTLDSRIVYPLLLRQPARRNSLYMPGFYWVLGAFFKLFGYSTVIARVPSILSFVLACYFIHVIANKLYGEKAALFSVALFAAVPLLLLFAFTAMMEIPLVAAGLAAFAVFLKANERIRHWVAPAVLVLPLLFRETGIIVGIIMLAVMGGAAWASPQRKRRLGYVCASAVLMLLVCGAVLKSPIGSGRPSLWKANVLIGRNYEVLYGDAFGTDKVPSTPADWVNGIRDKFLYDVQVLVRPKGESAGFVEQSVLWFILSGIPLGLVQGFWKRDAFAFGVAAAVALLLMGCLALYPVWGYRAVRILLLLFPFVAVVWGAVFGQLLKDSGPVVEAIPVVVLLALGGWGAVRLVRSQVQTEADTKANTKFIESVVRGDGGMVVSPFWLSLDYLNEHYPQYWSFVPSNCETMRLLDERYRIWTMILPEPDTGNDDDTPRRPPRNANCGIPLKFAEEREFNGIRFWVFRRGSR